MSGTKSSSSLHSRTRNSVLMAGLGLVLTVVGLIAAFFLAQSFQDLRNRASTGTNPYTGACTFSTQCAAGYICDGGQCKPNCERASGRPNGCSCNSSSQCASGACGRDPGDNTQACIPAASPTPTPATVTCLSAGQRVPAGVTLNCVQ